jgi:hypothetical protein
VVDRHAHVGIHAVITIMSISVYAQWWPAKLVFVYYCIIKIVYAAEMICGQGKAS